MLKNTQFSVCQTIQLSFFIAFTVTNVNSAAVEFSSRCECLQVLVSIHREMLQCVSPSLISFRLLCPSLFPWHQLWQDETVVVCLPVYTCCADLLLLYSRHRQADRWQPHWHQSRGPLRSLPPNSFFFKNVIWTDEQFYFASLKWPINTLFQA